MFFVTRKLAWPLRIILYLVMVTFLTACGGSGLHAWHTERLSEEFTVKSLDSGVHNFTDYQALEQRLFQELQDKVYSETSPGLTLNRYSVGSPADPSIFEENWNLSFELIPEQAIGGVLLLHGMSDSPYSLRALGARLHTEGYHVIGLRLPGHGTAPSGLRYTTGQDMAAATQLALDHLSEKVGQQPIHLIGYSTGAALALDVALKVVETGQLPDPASLILISPAIRVHATAGLAGFKNGLSVLPGLDGLAYVSVMDEFDPFKYNSFATNAASQVHRVTSDVDRRIRQLAESGRTEELPPILVFKSTVDATVTTEAVVDDLLKRLPESSNELVLFDINRHAMVKSLLLIDDPAPLTHQLVSADALPFGLTLVSNMSTESLDVTLRYKPAYSTTFSEPEPLGLSWPIGVISLSHVALTFPPDDPLYGIEPPADDQQQLYLGNLAIKGERGLLKVSESWLLRLRFNPFYDYLENRTLDWLEQTR